MPFHVSWIAIGLALIAPTMAAAEEVEQTATATEAKPLFDGKSLKGWRIAEKADFKSHGEVTVRDGLIALAAGTPATGIAWTGDAPKQNYEIQLEARRTEGSDFFCGLTFPVGDSLCTWIVGGWGGGVVGLSNVDHYSAAENETAKYMDFENDRWYRLRLRVTEKAIEAWIDDKPVIDLKTEGRKFDIWAEQQPVAPLGIATWYTGAELRKITLQELEKE